MHYYIHVIILLFLYGSFLEAIVAHEPKKVTIFVHGTRGRRIFPMIFLSSRLMDIERRFCACPFGLHHINTIDFDSYLKHIPLILAQADAQRFSAQHCYLFGWNGHVNMVERAKAAEQLFKELCQLAYKYKELYGFYPEITLIAHSHGGNVALGIAAYVPQELPFHIKTLILMATPIQQETSCYAYHEIFQEVISFHSHGDLMQCMDPQKLQTLRKNIHLWWKKRSCHSFKKIFYDLWRVPLFSKRHFKQEPKIKQINVQWHSYAPWSAQDFNFFDEFGPKMQQFLASFDRPRRHLYHLEFMLPLFLERIPALLDRLEKEPYESEKTIALQ